MTLLAFITIWRRDSLSAKKRLRNVDAFRVSLIQLKSGEEQEGHNQTVLQVTRGLDEACGVGRNPADLASGICR
jgi:hypothetical protein